MDKKQRLLDTLVTLDNIFGVSGEEYRVGEQLSKELKGCYDELIVDPIGNYIFHKKGNGKKVLLSLSVIFKHFATLKDYRSFRIGYAI